MQTVWKYLIPIAGEFEISMPAGADLLTIAVVGKDAYLWARVVPERRKEVRVFSLRGTGHPEADGRYVGTFMLNGGAFVGHVFEKQLTTTQ